MDTINNWLNNWGNLLEAHKLVKLGQVLPQSYAIVLANLLQQHPHKSWLVLVEDCLTAETLANELDYFCEENKFKVLSFPDREILPYDKFSAHAEIISTRLQTLCELNCQQQALMVIVPIATAMHFLSPREYIGKHSISLKVGDKLRRDDFCYTLVECGYNMVDVVHNHGEIAKRGSLIDLFPMGAKNPVRIDLLGEEIDSLRTFDPPSQLTVAQLSHLNILPAREFLYNQEVLPLFKQNWRDVFIGSNQEVLLYQQIKNLTNVAGLEYYLPLFFQEVHTLFDYLAQHTTIVSLGNIVAAAESFLGQCKLRYTQYAYDKNFPILPVERLFLSVENFFARCKDFSELRCTATEVAFKDNQINLSLQTMPDYDVKQCCAWQQQQELRVLYCVESEGRANLLMEKLQQQKISYDRVDSWKQFLRSDAATSLIVAPLQSGVWFSKCKVAIVTEKELYNRKVIAHTRHKKASSWKQDLLVSSLAELTIGAPVVHYEYGVGRYLGLQTLQHSDAYKADYAAISYYGEDKLYVPISNLDVLSRYSGADIANAPLHSLKQDKWQKDKARAIKKIQDVSAMLLDVYAKRQAQQGVAYKLDQQSYQAFAEEFCFEETLDQQKAISETLQDLQSIRPMDRVICGDVGFGKTEVAMRAAFVVAQNGYQVALLVPTTLLAQQHGQSFIDRFARFAVNVAVVSRFVDNKSQDNILTALAEGKIDIIIGTHKLLQGDIKFKNLGLLIIDEEHRFGVRQKEKFKALRNQVDVLTMTATPIPRTLNMALSGIRDISIISSPPANRLAVKTFVRPYQEALIKEAICREISRGGQVYYLHNNVQTIENCKAKLLQYLPNITIDIAHGQMPEKALEKVMLDFYHRRFAVLVCTSIIETGIDVASANTIIIERADKFGLAQLHQLRGRVGRSHHQAYAFLLSPNAAITADAQRRLEAIEAFNCLGTGFTLANQDLDIRGAGELLGDDQSGHVCTLGFTLYQELLEKTVDALQTGASSPCLMSHKEVEIELNLVALIPDDYLPDVSLRVDLYQRLAHANLQDLSKIRHEINDRFGAIPEEIDNLFTVMQFRLRCKDLGINSLKIGATGGTMRFVDKPSFAIDKLIDILHKQPDRYKLLGKNGVRISHSLPAGNDRVAFINSFLDKIS